MNAHQNARTTPHIRAEIVASYHCGDAVSAIAARFCVSTTTVYKWIRRHREAGAEGLLNKPSWPKGSGGRATGIAADHWHQLIAWLRCEFRMTAAEIAERLSIPRSTIARWLKQMGMGRLRDLEVRPPERRYQRQRPGELIHLDIKKLGRFSRIGHRITGDRTKQSNTRGVGWEFVHVAIDDATRLAYVEVLEDEKKWTATGFLLRAARWFRDRGIAIERVMTDNGSCYKSFAFGRLCRRLGARHLRTKPYTPQTNGKAERFIQILIREWAYGHTYRTSEARKADLPRWLDWYNNRRLHSAIGQQPPQAALNNLMRIHS